MSMDLIELALDEFRVQQEMEEAKKVREAKIAQKFKEKKMREYFYLFEPQLNEIFGHTYSQSWQLISVHGNDLVWKDPEFKPEWMDVQYGTNRATRINLKVYSKECNHAPFTAVIWNGFKNNAYISVNITCLADVGKWLDQQGRYFNAGGR